MGIVASQATNSRIVRVVALAAGQPIGLKTYIPNAEIRLHHDIRPRAVTLPTKI
jgi:hypothetical protein